MSQLRFIADTMLGTLARRLRMLGIDTLFLRDAEDSELKYFVRSQDRILLTKDNQLVQQIIGNAWLVQGFNAREEFASISSQLSTASCKLELLSLCLECNSRLEQVEGHKHRLKIPPYVLAEEKRFMGCPGCGKVYWEGTHGSNMKDEVSWMKRKVGAGS
jgi:uncharacterized protein with PIN domain